MTTKSISAVLTLVITVVLSSLVVTGCVGGGTTQSGDTTTPATTTEKQGDTTRTGVLSQVNGTFFLQESGKLPEAIDSYSVDLSQYLGQTITVTGQFSGDTLFVGKIE